MREPWVRVDPQFQAFCKTRGRNAPNEAQESGDANNSPSRERQCTGHRCCGLRIIPVKCDIFGTSLETKT